MDGIFHSNRSRIQHTLTFKNMGCFREQDAQFIYFDHKISFKGQMTRYGVSLKIVAAHTLKRLSAQQESIY